MGTYIAFWYLGILKRFTLHSGQMGTYAERLGNLEIGMFTLHTGQIGTSTIYDFMKAKVEFTLHSGQIGTSLLPPIAPRL